MTQAPTPTPTENQATAQTLTQTQTQTQTHAQPQVQAPARTAPRPDARTPEEIRRERDAVRRERMAAPLDFKSVSRQQVKRRPVLTAPGVFLVVAVPTMVAAALDAALTGSVRWIFGLVFVAASFRAATLVRRRDLLAAVIVPPIAYCAGLLVAVQCGVLRAGGGLVDDLASIGALLALKPRPLFLGTALAAALVTARWVGMRKAAKTAKTAKAAKAKRGSA